MFGGCYDNALPEERVKYGFLYGINDVKYQFGDSLIVLNDKECILSSRCTITNGDSSINQCPYLLSDIKNFISDNTLNLSYGNFIEVQIHGPIDLSRDVNRLVIDSKHLSNKSLVDTISKFTEKNKCIFELK